MTEISIDTAVYERRHGQPLGRAFWTFKIISPSVTSKDYVFTTDTPMSYHAACDKAREVAAARRSERIVLLPGD
jgi:hypothetical protein